MPAPAHYAPCGRKRFGSHSPSGQHGKNRQTGRKNSAEHPPPAVRDLTKIGFCRHLGIVIPIIYTSIITQTRRIVKRKARPSFIYILQKSPPIPRFSRPAGTSPDDCAFRHIPFTFAVRKWGKYHLLSNCTNTRFYPIILCFAGQYTAVFGVVTWAGKFHLLDLCGFLHFVNIYPSLCNNFCLLILHNFSGKFSTSAQVAQNCKNRRFLADFSSLNTADTHG